MEKKIQDTNIAYVDAGAAEVTAHRKKLLGTVDFDVWKNRLERFMATQLVNDQKVEVSEMSLPSAGGSSGTLMFSANSSLKGTVPVTRKYVLRYTTEGGLFHDYNLPGQYSILQALHRKDIPVPEPLCIDIDGSTLGVIGYLMAHVSGGTVPASYHQAGLLFDATPEGRRRMVFDVIAKLANVHEVDIRDPGFDFLWKRGNGATALERDLDWWWTSLTCFCPDEADSLEPIRQWILSHQPPDSWVALNHGDTMLCNYMFKGEQVESIIDWELAFLGNPTADVAYQVLTDKFLSLGTPRLAGMPTEQEWRTQYEKVSAKCLEHWEFYLAAVAFKLHISILLVCREVPAEMAGTSKRMLEHTWRDLGERLAVARTL